MVKSLDLTVNLMKQNSILKVIYLIIILNVSPSFIGGCNELFTFESPEIDGWNDHGDIGWQFDSFNGNNSTYSLRSGPIENSGVSGISINLSGPSIVSFWWKVDETPNRIGQLTFSVDGSTKYICCSREWSNEMYFIKDDKSHELKWEFIKFRSYPQYSGAGWIDDIYITSNITSCPLKIQNQSLNNSTKLLDSTFSSVCVDGKLQENEPNNHTWTSIENAIIDAYINKIKKIVIKNGNYPLNESLILDQEIYLEGEEKGNVKIRAIKNDSIGIKIKSNNCILQNISLYDYVIGIDVARSSNITIQQCLFNCDNGIVVVEGNCMNVVENEFDLNGGSKDFGIFIDHSSLGLISNNNFSGNIGILLSYCNDYEITRNNLTGIYTRGFKISDSSNIDIYFNNLKSYNNAWLDFSPIQSIRFDCNWWKDLSGGCIDSLNKENPKYNGFILDHHPYCVRDGWDKKNDSEELVE